MEGKQQIDKIKQIKCASCSSLLHVFSGFIKYNGSTEILLTCNTCGRVSLISVNELGKVKLRKADTNYLG